MTRDWREWAYLRSENWPGAIPWSGPKREYGPYPWAPTDGPDPYPHYHPNAGSCGDEYLGDVCPRCGVPLPFTTEVVLVDGTRGVFADIDELDNPTPAYHLECWAEKRADMNRGLGEFA